MGGEGDVTVVGKLKNKERWSKYKQHVRALYDKMKVEMRESINFQIDETDTITLSVVIPDGIEFKETGDREERIRDFMFVIPSDSENFITCMPWHTRAGSSHEQLQKNMKAYIDIVHIHVHILGKYFPCQVFWQPEEYDDYYPCTKEYRTELILKHFPQCASQYTLDELLAYNENPYIDPQDPDWNDTRRITTERYLKIAFRAVGRLREPEPITQEEMSDYCRVLEIAYKCSDIGTMPYIIDFFNESLPNQVLVLLPESTVRVINLISEMESFNNPIQREMVLRAARGLISRLMSLRQYKDIMEQKDDWMEKLLLVLRSSNDYPLVQSAAQALRSLSQRSETFRTLKRLKWEDELMQALSRVRQSQYTNHGLHAWNNGDDLPSSLLQCLRYAVSDKITAEKLSRSDLLSWVIHACGNSKMSYSILWRGSPNCMTKFVYNGLLIANELITFCNDTKLLDLADQVMSAIYEEELWHDQEAYQEFKLKHNIKEDEYDSSDSEADLAAFLELNINADDKKQRKLLEDVFRDPFNICALALEIGKLIHIKKSVISHPVLRSNKPELLLSVCSSKECRNEEVIPRQFQVCSRCKEAKYCSRNCQTKHWNEHKIKCLQVTK
jgi:hypothetical protein